MNHRLSIVAAAFTFLTMVGALIYFNAFVPRPDDFLARRDIMISEIVDDMEEKIMERVEAKVRRQWFKINAVESNLDTLTQRQDSFEAEMRRSVNPQAWMESALIRRDIEDLQATIVRYHIELDPGTFGRRPPRHLGDYDNDESN